MVFYKTSLFCLHINTDSLYHLNIDKSPFLYHSIKYIFLFKYIDGYFIDIDKRVYMRICHRNICTCIYNRIGAYAQLGEITRK